MRLMEEPFFSLFFSEIPEQLKPLFQEGYPWEALKGLKDFLYETLPELPKKVLIHTPLPQSYFLTVEGEVIEISLLEEEGNDYYLKGEKLEGAILRAGVCLIGRRFFFGRGVVVEPFALLKEPGYFGEDVEIRHGAYVRGSVYAERGAVIGHTTEVKNSILFSQAKASHFAYVGDSILGTGVNLGAGTKLANLTFLKKEIKIKVGETIYSTGLKKFGAILGDKVQTGCNAVLQPGTLVGKGSFLWPGVTAGPGFIPPGSKVKN